MNKQFITLLLAIIVAVIPTFVLAASVPNATEIISNSVNLWRGKTNGYFEGRMEIFRPNAPTKKYVVHVWTKGQKKTLAKFLYPQRIKGQGILLLGDDMWQYDPRSKRTIKLSNSVRANSFMGSDLSYDDISKTSDLIDKYNHKLLKTEKKDGHTVYTVEITPLPKSPIVWGKEIMVIRDDWVFLEHDYYDQAGKKIKTMKVTKIINIDGIPFPSEMIATNLEKPGNYTNYIADKVDFKINIDPNLFTMINLQKDILR